jgi:hypothetical protein
MAHMLVCAHCNKWVEIQHQLYHRMQCGDLPNTGYRPIDEVISFIQQEGDDRKEGACFYTRFVGDGVLVEEDAGQSNTVDAFEPYVEAMLQDLVRFGYVRNGKDSKHFKFVYQRDYVAPASTDPNARAYYSHAFEGYPRWRIEMAGFDVLWCLQCENGWAFTTPNVERD